MPARFWSDINRIAKVQFWNTLQFSLQECMFDMNLSKRRTFVGVHKPNHIGRKRGSQGRNEKGPHFIKPGNRGDYEGCSVDKHYKGAVFKQSCNDNSIAGVKQWKCSRKTKHCGIGYAYRKMSIQKPPQDFL